MGNHVLTFLLQFPTWTLCAQWRDRSRRYDFHRRSGSFLIDVECVWCVSLQAKFMLLELYYENISHKLVLNEIQIIDRGSFICFFFCNNCAIEKFQITLDAIDTNWYSWGRRNHAVNVYVLYGKQSNLIFTFGLFQNMFLTFHLKMRW